MARRKVGKLTEVKVDLSSYTYLINGVAGIGKTTTVCEIGQKEFGVDGFLLLTIGQEPKPQHIGNLLQDTLLDWDDLEEAIDDICEYKNEDYPNLRMIGIDSVDEVFRLACKKVVDMHNKKAGSSDKVTSVAQAFGGFQRGETKVVELVTETLFKLRDVGISLFFIGHTKTKNKTDQLTDIEFEQITSNLDNKYYNCIKDKVNIVMCAYMEREFEDIKVRKDVFSKTNKQIGAIKSERRVVSFRDDENAIDTKSHLKHICSKCNLDSEIMINELKDAMKKQAQIFNPDVTDKDIESKVEAERLENSIKEIPKFEKVEDKQTKLDQIKANMSKLDLTKLQPIMTKYGVTSFGDAEVIPTECLDEILSLI